MAEFLRSLSNKAKQMAFNMSELEIKVGPRGGGTRAQAGAQDGGLTDPAPTHRWKRRPTATRGDRTGAP